MNGQSVPKRVRGETVTKGFLQDHTKKGIEHVCFQKQTVRPVMLRWHMMKIRLAQNLIVHGMENGENGLIGLTVLQLVLSGKI
jgi:hypothetical protein